MNKVLGSYINKHFFLSSLAINDNIRLFVFSTIVIINFILLLSVNFISYTLIT